MERVMPISFRPACVEDFDYCARLYFDEMKNTIRELKLDPTTHAAGFRRQWQVSEVRIIRANDADVGWLQSRTEGDALFLAQLFVEAPFQRRGIGTQVVDHLVGEAAGARQTVTLAVVKSNPALRLYQRLGFRVTHDDERKFYMRREPDKVHVPRTG
jgi:ribosomal protein S18 acetylase RimI-like enzyme